MVSKIRTAIKAKEYCTCESLFNPEDSRTNHSHICIAEDDCKCDLLVCYCIKCEKPLRRDQVRSSHSIKIVKQMDARVYNV